MTDDALHRDTANGPSVPAPVEPQLDAVLDSLPDIVFACDGSSRLLFVNAAVRGRELREVVPAPFAVRLEAARQRVANGQPDEFETLLEPAGRWFHVRCFPRSGGGLTVSCRDSTEGRAQEEGLRASEARYRAMIEDQTEIICRHRPGDGTYTYVNEVFCRFFGRSREELIGRPWHLEAVPEDQRTVRTALEQITPDHPVVTVENRVFDGAGGSAGFR